MQWEKFQDQFHPSWWNKIKPFIESKECDNIYSYLKQRSKEGRQIAPLSSLTYRVFKDMSLDDIKIIILGYCPYHTFSNGSPVADGLAFSCSVTGRLQPSLRTIYEGIEEELFNGLNLNYVKHPDLSYWIKQGVFLLNSSLTVEKGKAGSHQSLWEPFTKYLLESVLAYKYIPIIFVGKDAQHYEKYVTVLTHGEYFKIEHPSAAARERRLWDTKGVFTKVNKILENEKFNKINWLCSEEEISDIINNNKPPF